MMIHEDYGIRGESKNMEYVSCFKTGSTRMGNEIVTGHYYGIQLNKLFGFVKVLCLPSRFRILNGANNIPQTRWFRKSSVGRISDRNILSHWFDIQLDENYDQEFKL